MNRLDSAYLSPGNPMPPGEDCNATVDEEADDTAREAIRDAVRELTWALESAEPDEDGVVMRETRDKEVQAALRALAEAGFTLEATQ